MDLWLDRGGGGEGVSAATGRGAWSERQRGAGVDAIPFTGWTNRWMDGWISVSREKRWKRQKEKSENEMRSRITRLPGSSCRHTEI